MYVHTSLAFSFFTYLVLNIEIPEAGYLGGIAVGSIPTFSLLQLYLQHLFRIHTIDSNFLAIYRQF